MILDIMNTEQLEENENGVKYFFVEWSEDGEVLTATFGITSDNSIIDSDGIPLVSTFSTFNSFITAHLESFFEPTIEELEQELADAFNEARKTIKKMKEIDFGYEMLVHNQKWLGLGALEIIKIEVSGQVLFVPTILNYVYVHHNYVSNGFTSYELAYACVGRCLDAAEKDKFSRMFEGKIQC
jgi:hypothetical protein